MNALKKITKLLCCVLARKRINNFEHVILSSCKINRLIRHPCLDFFSQKLIVNFLQVFFRAFQDRLARCEIPSRFSSFPICFDFLLFMIPPVIELFGPRPLQLDNAHQTCNSIVSSYLKDM